ncbi:hypothetical protein BDV10DRAFT_195996 [Aspergillus recurvatus]
MASTVPPQAWESGYARPSPVASWEDKERYEGAHYTLPVHEEPPTATVHNHLGVAHLRTWPSLSPAVNPWSNRFYCLAGPFGLALGCILARQGITFRIVDKASSPCRSGRADGVHPRALEILQAWGLANEVAEECPILNSTVLYRNGVKLFHDHSSTCDSRYKGIHTITQSQVGRIYIRDLLRHKVLVERETTVRKCTVHSDSHFSHSHPIEAKLQHIHNGREEVVRAQYLIGAEGAQSMILQQMGVPFGGINGEKARKVQEDRKARRNASAVAEVLEQLNKIIPPYTVEFASPMIWFSVWRVSERVARRYSTPDLRVHLGGLCIRNKAEPSVLLPTYDNERRLFANRVIRCSGAYLRFICNPHLPLAASRDLGDEPGPIRPCSLRNGVRAPSPRICFATGKNGYLYDELTGVSRFHILVFTSDLRGPIRNALAAFSRQAFHDSSGFYSQFGGAGPFNIILITKAQPWETGVLLGPRDNNDDLRGLRKNATVLYDNRVPDENAHYLYGINHARGAVVVVRPDLAVGVSVFPMGVGALESYFASFLLPVKEYLGYHGHN